MLPELQKARLRSLVISELASIGAKFRGDEAHIVCPFHDDHDPSLQVHIGHKIVPGSYNCFACGASGNWNRLAETVYLKTFDGMRKPGQAKADKTYSADPTGLGGLREDENPFEMIAEVLKAAEVLQKPRLTELTGIEELPPGFTWRGIGRSFYKSLGGKFFWERSKNPMQYDDMEWLYLPITMNKKAMGYTLCALKPHKPKYKTLANTEECFLLYDEVPQGEPIVLVEGHFDALRLFSAGIYSMAVFGTQNWSAIKRSYLIAKNPRKLIVLFDGDKAGYDGAQAVFNDIRAGVDTEIVYLPATEPAMDPGNMSTEWIEYIRSKVV